MGILDMSVTGAVMILAVLTIRALAMHHLPKKTFLALWGLVMARLLLPFRVESALSLQNLWGVREAVGVREVVGFRELGVGAFPPVYSLETGAEVLQAAVQTVVPQAEKVANMVPSAAPPTVGVGISPLLLIWLIGAACMGVYFLMNYLKTRRELDCALPVQESFIAEWLETHPLKRRVAIRVSDRINSPLTYGIIHPVILLPKKTNWQDRKRLTFILEHEFTHILRWDAMLKLFLAIALCLHWFNPLVWLMYKLANRDIELSCDETVLKKLGDSAAYATTLLEMEAEKSTALPFVSDFSRYVIQERITSIMKYKKTPLIAVIVAVLLVVGVTTSFATSATTPDVLPTLPDELATARVEENTGTKKPYSFDAVLPYMFDGYREMSVAEFRTQALEMMEAENDEETWQDLGNSTTLDILLERGDKRAEFFSYTLYPLTLEEGQAANYFLSTICQKYMAHCWVAVSVLDEDSITVGEYEQAIQNMEQDIVGFAGSVQEGWEADIILEKSNEFMNALKNNFNGQQMKIQYDWDLAKKVLQQRVVGTDIFQPVIDLPKIEPDQCEVLLTQYTEGYEKLSLAEFNERIKVARRGAAYSRAYAALYLLDLGMKNCPDTFSTEEKDFLRSLALGKNEISDGEGIAAGFMLNTGANSEDMGAVLSFEIPDTRIVTVQERNDLWLDIIDSFGAQAAKLDILTPDEQYIAAEEMVEKLQQKYSGDKILFSLEWMTSSEYTEKYLNA